MEQEFCCVCSTTVSMTSWNTCESILRVLCSNYMHYYPCHDCREPSKVLPTYSSHLRPIQAVGGIGIYTHLSWLWWINVHHTLLKGSNYSVVHLKNGWDIPKNFRYVPPILYLLAQNNPLDVDLKCSHIPMF